LVGQFLVFAKPRSAFVTVGDSLSTALRMTKRFRIFVGFGKDSAPSDSVGEGNWLCAVAVDGVGNFG